MTPDIIWRQVTGSSKVIGSEGNYEKLWSPPGVYSVTSRSALLGVYSLKFEYLSRIGLNKRVESVSLA